MMADLTAQIEKLRQEDAELVNRMRIVRQSFVHACAPFLNEWFMEETGKCVTNNPDVTRANAERLSDLKKAVAGLQPGTAEWVKKAVDRDDLWEVARRRIDGDSAPFPMYLSVPDGIQHAVRNVAAKLKPILEKYGYPQPDMPFLFANAWSANMIQAVQQYSELAKECLDVRDKIAALEREKGEAEANDLWNNA